MSHPQGQEIVLAIARIFWEKEKSRAYALLWITALP